MPKDELDAPAGPRAFKPAIADNITRASTTINKQMKLVAPSLKQTQSSRIKANPCQSSSPPSTEREASQAIALLAQGETGKAAAEAVKVSEQTMVECGDSCL